MKRVVIAIQNSLVSEAIMRSLKSHGMLLENPSIDSIDDIAEFCRTFFADILVMDVTRFGTGTFDNRMEISRIVRKSNPNIKVSLIYDNVSDNEMSQKISSAKEMGIIDTFFYQSVPSDYIADVISTM